MTRVRGLVAAGSRLAGQGLRRVRATLPEMTSAARLSATRYAVASGLVWLLMGLLNVVLSSALIPLPGGGIEARVMRQVFDAGQHLAAGLAFGFLALLGARFRLRWWGTLLCLYALAALVGAGVLRDDFPGPTRTLAELTGLGRGAVVTLKVLGLAGVPPVVAALGHGLGKGFRRLLAPFLFVGIYALNAVVFPYDNRGGHLFLSWAAALILAPTVASVLPAWRSRAQGVVLLSSAVLLGGAAPAMFAPPTNSARVDLLRWQASVLAPFVGKRHGKDTGSVELIAKAGPFFEDRSRTPAVPPTRPPLVANPIVLLITIDAVRADLLTDEAHAPYVRTMRELEKRGAFFRRARAPGSQTVYTLSALSTGKYFSELYWSRFRGELWPHEDESPHFAEILEKAKVRTQLARPMKFFGPEWGVLRGFEDTELADKRRKFAHASAMTRKIREYLMEPPEGPTFIYAHYMDPHHPYTSGGKGKTPFDRYLGEVQLVDGYLAQIVALIKREKLADRTFLIVSSDHGEAFGEHSATLHATTLYDELLHVPLIVVGPGIPRETINVPVSLIDLGPTILDLFGVETPGTFMGQSLVPLLRGEERTFTRPIVAEGRLKRAMVFNDGIKVIRDTRAGTLEVYDLDADPGETKNLADALDKHLEERVALLDLFFEVHTLKKKDYKVPMRP